MSIDDTEVRESFVDIIYREDSSALSLIWETSTGIL